MLELLWELRADACECADSLFDIEEPARGQSKPWHEAYGAAHALGRAYTELQAKYEELIG